MSQDGDSLKMDSAARAAWLYFIAGNTQEEIAAKMRISRPTAQRLVTAALSNHLVTFRFEHKIARCMELAEALRLEGKVLSDGINNRLTAVPIGNAGDRLVVGVAGGKRKVCAIHAALAGGLLTGLITDETTAESIVALKPE